MISFHKTYPVPSSVRRGVSSCRQGSAGAATTATATAPGGAEAERRARGQGSGGLGGGGRARVVGDGPRAVAGALGRADAVLGAAAGAAGGPPGGEVDHVVEPVSRAEAGTATLLAVPRPLEAPGLSAAGVLRRVFFVFVYVSVPWEGGRESEHGKHDKHGGREQGGKMER